MGLFDSISKWWTELRTPTRIPIPTTRPTVPPGTNGGVQVIQVPPSLRQAREPIHATTPTVHIHDREPAVKKDVRIARDPRTIAETRQALVSVGGAVKERISTGWDIGVGEQGDITKMKVPEKVVPFEKYATAPIHRKASELATTYKEWMGRQQGVVDMPTGATRAVLEPLQRFGTGIVRSPAIMVETAGMIPLGVEFAAREPAIAAHMVPIGLGIMAGGIHTGIQERPFETAGELVGMMALPTAVKYGVPKVKIPYTISRKAVLPEGVLLKGKIHVETATPRPSTALTEYKPPKVETFVGKIKGETADVYVKVPESELSVLQRITSETASRNILTKEGKFMVIEEPRYIDAAPITQKMLVGDILKPTLREKVSGAVPYEIVRKVELQPVRLQTTVLPERVMIPEFLRTIDVTPRPKSYTMPDVAPTKRMGGMIERGKTTMPKDMTKTSTRKDITEIPYSRDVTVGITQETNMIGRILSKSERSLVRDAIIKDRPSVEPAQSIYKPSTRTFESVGGVGMTGGLQQMYKPLIESKTKAAPVALKEKVSIPTIDLTKSAPLTQWCTLAKPTPMMEMATKTKTAPVALKEKVSIPTIDLEALFKRPTYEQIITRPKTVTKTKRTKFGIFPLYADIAPHADPVAIEYPSVITQQKYDTTIVPSGPSTPIPTTITVAVPEHTPITEPVTETRTLKKPPPKYPPVTTLPPSLPTLVVVPPFKMDKKPDKRKKAPKKKGFQYYIENPVASIFDTPFGKVK